MLCVLHTRLSELLQAIDFTPPLFPELFHLGTMKEHLTQRLSQVTFSEQLFPSKVLNPQGLQCEMKETFEDVCDGIQHYVANVLALLHELDELMYSHPMNMKFGRVIRGLEVLLEALVTNRDMEYLLALPLLDVSHEAGDGDGDDDGNKDAIENQMIVPTILDHGTLTFAMEYDLITSILPSKMSRFGMVDESWLLRHQQYRCVGCHVDLTHHMFGWDKNYSLCRWFGGLCCKQWCHKGQARPLPHRMLYCWDFKEYKVSRIAAAWIDRLWSQPLFDVLQWNALLVEGVPILQQFLLVQKQLVRLLSLTAPIWIEKRQDEKYWRLIEQRVGVDRLHLITNIGLLSMDDMVMIQSGVLGKVLAQLYGDICLADKQQLE